MSKEKRYLCSHRLFGLKWLLEERILARYREGSEIGLFDPLLVLQLTAASVIALLQTEHKGLEISVLVERLLASKID
jgi:uncharacterized phage-like protein YoqJ